MSGSGRKKNEANRSEASEARKRPEQEVVISSEQYEDLCARAEESRQSREQMLRAMAELENVRKRLEKEKQDSLVFSNQELVRELLPILDNFQRALETRPEAESDGYRQGVEMILKQFKDTLSRQGLEEIEALGRPFDPFLHEAVACVETDEHPDGEVAEEILRGYLFKGRLLRPTAVKVYSNAGGAPPPERD